MKRDEPLAPWHRVEAVLGALVLAVSLFGLPLWVLTTPVYVRTLVSLVASDASSGIGEAAVLDAAESVRRFVTDPSAPALPDTIAGRPAFDAAAVEHLLDVRAALVPARALASASALVAIAWFAARRRSARGRAVTAAAMRWAGGLVLASGALAVAAGLSDFDRLFTWFHGLFFEPGTWLFAEDALLIQVFPLSFWTASGAVWALLAVGGAAALLVCGRRSRFTRTRLGV